MKAIILAAGMGTRMNIDYPKALLKIDDKSILEHKVTGLRDVGIDDIYVVTGYKHEQFPDLDVTYVYNKDYDTKGNAHSFKLALEKCGTNDFVVCLDGDLMLDYRIYFEIQPKFQYFVDNLNHYWHAGDLGVKIDFDGRVVDIGRNYEYCVMLGMAVYPPEFLKKLADYFSTTFMHEEELISIVRDYMTAFHVIPKFVEYPWVEIDTPEDFDKALKLFNNPAQELGGTISLKELNSLYRDMGEFGGLHLSMRNLQRDDIIIRTSTFSVIRMNGRLIGSGRFFTDGAYAVAIWDVMVRPAYQGIGIGTKIMNDLIKKAEILHPIKIFLIADPGKEDFYRKFGMELTRAPAMEKRYDYDRFSPNWEE